MIASIIESEASLHEARITLQLLPSDTVRHRTSVHLQYRTKWYPNPGEGRQYSHGGLAIGILPNKQTSTRTV